MYISSEYKEKPPYEPGLERWSNYKSIWIRHWVEFQRVYPFRYQSIFGTISDEKRDQIRKLIRCGKFKNGFQRHTCPECGVILVVPFTCKSRLCLSCSRKRLFGWSLNLSVILNTSLNQTHVTFTIPGTIAKLLFKRKYDTEQMMPLAAGIYKNLLASTAKLKGKDYQAGVLATLHKSGNGLNYNPHVHLIGTRELVDRATGEVLDVPYVPYAKVRHVWKKAFLQHLVKQGFLSENEMKEFHDKYKNGFHVYFQPIKGNHNDVLFRTAEYIATGYFHNSQIIEVNHRNKTVTFRYRRFMERGTRKKHFATKTMHMHEFMARMLFFLPDKHRKMIRYYGIYARNIERKLDYMEKSTWARAIKHCFDKEPEKCPECSLTMVKDIVYSLRADREIKKMIATHALINGAGCYLPSMAHPALAHP